MPVQTETLKEELFGFLNAHGYRPIMLDSNAKQVSVTDDAELFQFTFLQGPVEYGQVTISFDKKGHVQVYFDDRVTDSPKSDSGSMSWSDFVKQLNTFCASKNTRTKYKNQNHLHYDMAKREHTRNKELNESYHVINKKTSYNDSIPTVKMIIHHSRDLQEGEQRFRSVSKIFIENSQGEKFLVPSKKPGIGKIFAMHIREGGNPYDERGSHIAELVDEYEKMSSFRRAVKNKKFNESANDLINKGLVHHQQLRETLKSLTTTRGYSSYFENYTPIVNESEHDPIDDLFVTNNIDFRIESVLPILSRLKSSEPVVNESTDDFLEDLVNWADSITEFE
jgi:hypothetical protein